MGNYSVITVENIPQVCNIFHTVYFPTLFKTLFLARIKYILYLA